jgi:hypothetical protein
MGLLQVLGRCAVAAVVAGVTTHGLAACGATPGAGVDAARDGATPDVAVDTSVGVDAPADVAALDAATPIDASLDAVDASADGPETDGGTVDAPPPDASGPDGGGPVTFAYRPAWDGVTAVAVYGAFGRADDWRAPFAALTRGSDGTYRATVAVPAGAHAYLYRVTGDRDGPTAPDRKSVV